MKTIKDIAEEAKVSTGTVDRVIHKRPGVSPKTREKVQKLLDKYDFERNILASTLAFKKKVQNCYANTIGHI
ncbi:LacI family DNA-binding transcriptional regulator [Zobellia nedashkovskayae]